MALFSVLPSDRHSPEPYPFEMTPDEQEALDQQVVEQMVHCPLFDTLTSDDLQKIARYMNPINIAKEDVLCKEGDRGDHMVFVVDGRLEVYKDNDYGSKTRIGLVGTGGVIGEMALVEHTVRSATVIAGRDCDLLALERNKFEHILEKYPAIGVKLLTGIIQLMSKNLRQTSTTLVDHIPVDPADAQ